MAEWLVWQKPSAERAEGGAARERGSEHRAGPRWGPQSSSAALWVQAGDAELQAVRARTVRIRLLTSSPVRLTHATV